MPTKKKEKNSLQLLKIIFILLIFLVFILGIMIYQKEQKKKQTVSANITIPILEADSEYEFGIDTLALSKEKNKEYVFKIANYNKQQQLKEDTTYYVDIENHTKNTIAVMKNAETEDLMQGEDTIVLEDTFSQNKKEEVYYHLYLTFTEDLNSDEFIYIRIVSQKD